MATTFWNRKRGRGLKAQLQKLKASGIPEDRSMCFIVDRGRNYFKEMDTFKEVFPKTKTLGVVGKAYGWELFSGSEHDPDRPVDSDTDYPEFCKKCKFSDLCMCENDDPIQNSPHRYDSDGDSTDREEFDPQAEEPQDRNKPRRFTHHKRMHLLKHKFHESVVFFFVGYEGKDKLEKWEKDQRWMRAAAEAEAYQARGSAAEGHDPVGDGLPSVSQPPEQEEEVVVEEQEPEVSGEEEDEEEEVDQEEEELDEESHVEEEDEEVAPPPENQIDSGMEASSESEYSGEDENGDYVGFWHQVVGVPVEGEEEEGEAEAGPQAGDHQQQQDQKDSSDSDDNGEPPSKYLALDKKL